MNKYLCISILFFPVMIGSVSFNNQRKDLHPLSLKIKDSLGRLFQSKLPLPRFLRTPLTEVKHIRSYMQRGGACGWYVVLNACAIQELVEQNKEITADAIEKIVLRLISYISAHRHAIASLIGRSDLFNGLYHEQQFRLAEHLGLQNFYDLIVEGNMIGLWNNKKNAISDIECVPRSYFINDMMQLLVKEKGIVKHFMLTVNASVYDDYHVVLISFIKHPGKSPIIIYMDSNNISLAQCSLDYPTPFFVTKFLCCLLNLSWMAP